MERFELIALVAGQIYVAEGDMKAAVLMAAGIVEQAQSFCNPVKPATPKPKPAAEPDRTGDLLAGLDEAAAGLNKVEAMLDEAEPKKRGRPRKDAAELSAPVAATAAAKPKVEPEPKGARQMYEYFGFCCEKCESDRMRVSLFDGTNDAEAYCCGCGHNEKFKISPEDSLEVVTKGTLRNGLLSPPPKELASNKETPAAKKAAPVAAPAPQVTGQITTTEWTDPKTGKLMLMESWTDEEGEVRKRVREAPLDLPSGQWSDGKPATPKNSPSVTPSSVPETRPTISDTVTNLPECRNAPPTSSQSPSVAVKLADELIAYQPPAVDLDGARVELKAMVLAWPKERQIEKYEKLLSVTWDDAQADQQIDKLVGGMLGVFG